MNVRKVLTGLGILAAAAAVAWVVVMGWLVLVFMLGFGGGWG